MPLTSPLTPSAVPFTIHWQPRRSPVFCIHRRCISASLQSGDLTVSRRLAARSRFCVPCASSTLSVSGESHCLHTDHVGQPLMMKARRIHRFLDVHSVIDHAHQDIGHGGDDRRTCRASPAPETACRPCSTMVGVIADKRTLARPNRIRRRPGSGRTCWARPAWTEKSSISLFSRKPRPFGGDARAKTVIERGGHRDRVALGIHHRIMRRVVGFATALGRADAPAAYCSSWLKIAGRFRSPLGAGPCRDRSFPARPRRIACQSAAPRESWRSPGSPRNSARSKNARRKASSGQVDGLAPIGSPIFARS